MSRMLLHFSERPDIEVFRPHLSRTAKENRPMVWAIDEDHAPSYWFPRDCPRACCWRGDAPPDDATALLRPGVHRMHAVEWSWVKDIFSCRLFAYSFDPEPFVLLDPVAGYWSAERAVIPEGVEPVGSLIERHASARIELRLVPDLRPLISEILASSLPFSIIRAANL
ncbi:MAG: hypothetical protein JOZ55_09805 [Alphaproteobacteria bacterium]|nr:hypothetical protein [Alphaproteobacteria bacterium]